MWELQVFLHPVPYKVPVHKMQSCTKMCNVEPGKNSCLTHVNAALIYIILRAGADTPVCSSVLTNDFLEDESNLKPVLPVFPQRMLSAYCVSGMKPAAQTITRICKLLCCLV